MKDTYYIQGAFYLFDFGFFSIYIIQILQFSALLFSDSWEELAVHFLSFSFSVPGDLDFNKGRLFHPAACILYRFFAKERAKFSYLRKIFI